MAPECQFAATGQAMAAGVVKGKAASAKAGLRAALAKRSCASQ
jgi:hypothetical protein